MVTGSLHMSEQKIISELPGFEPLLFKNKADPEIKGILKNLSEDGWEEKTERAILCMACKNKICACSSGMEVNGRHQHTFYNPEGVIYHIGCFASAPGCIIHGKPTLHFTWFEGYRWNFALCGNCGTHLGWHYRADGGSKFFGLIFNKLAEGG